MKKIKDRITREKLQKELDNILTFIEIMDGENIEKIEEIKEELRLIYIDWKLRDLREIAPRKAYQEWEEEEKGKPVTEDSLKRLELKIKGKKCKSCGELFIPIKSNQKYCSTTCRDREAKRRYREKQRRLSKENKK